MSHSTEERITRIRICHSLLQNGVSPEEIPRQLGVHRATIYRWMEKIEQKGIQKYIREYRQAKKGRKQPRKTSVLAEVRIYKIRTEYKGCCGEKIKYILKKTYGQYVSVSTIYRILGKRYILRSKWKKYSTRGFVRKGTKPREVVQTDTVDFGGLYAFTEIDTYTKEVTVTMKPRLTSTDGREALSVLLGAFGPIDHIQRDGGSEFKGEWQTYASTHIPSIRTARPYKKNEQAFIERFNGILRKECLGYLTYNKKDLDTVQQRVNEYLIYYHTKRPHLSLNMQTPTEFAAAHAASMSHLT